MSIRPVDYQIMLPKTNDLARIQNEEQHRQQSATMQQASNVQQKAENGVNHVHSQDKAQQAAIREKQEKQENKKHKKEEKRKSKGGYNAEMEKDNRTETTSFIDIKI